MLPSLVLFFFVTCVHSDVLVSSHITLHRAQMPHVKKKNTIIDLNLVQDGDSVFPPGRRIHLRHQHGNKAATGNQIGPGIRGKHHPALNSGFFLQLFRDVILLARNLISWQSTRCVDRHTHRAPHLLMHSCCTDVPLLVVRVYSHIDPGAPA